MTRHVPRPVNITGQHKSKYGITVPQPAAHSHDTYMVIEYYVCLPIQSYKCIPRPIVK